MLVCRPFMPMYDNVGRIAAEKLGLLSDQGLCLFYQTGDNRETNKSVDLKGLQGRRDGEQVQLARSVPSPHHPSIASPRASTVHRIAAALQRNAAPYLQASTPLPISHHSATCYPRNPDKTTKTPQPFFLFTPSREEKSRDDDGTCQPNRTDPSSMVPRFGVYCSLARGRRITLFSVRFTKVLLSSADRSKRKKGGRGEKINPQNRARERTRPSRFYAACHLLRACISWISL